MCQAARVLDYIIRDAHPGRVRGSAGRSAADGKSFFGHQLRPVHHVPVLVVVLRLRLSGCRGLKLVRRLLRIVRCRRHYFLLRSIGGNKKQKDHHWSFCNPHYNSPSLLKQQVSLVTSRGTLITVSATNNSLAVAREFSRPRLAVLPADKTSLRHSIPHAPTVL